ncbi:MAG: hypothetical protein IT344_03255 [Candidatus Dadabacteria bacterium]|nr:hypothetical protein [Candidatus Dadabacteria bacterium]
MESAVSSLVFLDPPGLKEAAIFAVFLAIVIYGSVRSSRSIESLRKKAVILSLHVLAFMVICFLLLNPAVRVDSYKEEKRRLAVLVDGSWSMNLPGGEGEGTRIDAARNFLKDNSGFFSGLDDDFVVEYYTFGSGLTPSSRDSVMSEAPHDGSTDFGRLLKELRGKNSRGELDEAIIISDGGRNGDTADEDGEDEKSGLRINTVGALTGDASPDLWIDGIKSSEVSFLRYPYSVRVNVRTTGKGGMSIPVSLYDGDKLAAIKEVAIDGSSKAGSVEFEINPLTLGRRIYTAVVPVMADETITENNQKSFYTDVIINKIRILHVAGSPSWDVRFLRKALKRNPNVDLVSFFILRDPTDLVFATENELSLIPFPVNEIFGSELGTFDIVIFQNFNFQPYGIFGFHLRSIRDYVLNEGGAFLMIGGNKSFDSGNYGATPISEILPVELDYIPRGLTETINDRNVHPKLTMAGKNHPIMRIFPDKRRNEEEWNAMPELEGFNMVHGLSPDAVPLLASPDGEPILAVAKVGTGKAATFLSDSSWKWNFVRGSEGDVSPMYEKFWNRLFLWFVNDPDLNDVRVETDKAVYAPGEKAEIRLWELGGEEAAESPHAMLVRPDGEAERLTLERRGDSMFTAEIEPGETGIYRVTAAEDGGGAADEEPGGISFIVEPPAKEVRGPTSDEGYLKSIASGSGGVYVRAGDGAGRLRIDDSRKKTVTGYETKELWDSPFFLLLILGLLFSEWSLRRRWGLK